MAEFCLVFGAAECVGVDAEVGGADLMAEFCRVLGGAGVGEADDDGDGRGSDTTEGEGACCACSVCRAWGGARSWTASGSEVRARRIAHGTSCIRL